MNDVFNILINLAIIVVPLYIIFSVIRRKFRKEVKKSNKLEHVNIKNKRVIASVASIVALIALYIMTHNLLLSTIVGVVMEFVLLKILKT